MYSMFLFFDQGWWRMSRARGSLHADGWRWQTASHGSVRRRSGRGRLQRNSHRESYPGHTLQPAVRTPPLRGRSAVVGSDPRGPVWRARPARIRLVDPRWKYVSRRGASRRRSRSGPPKPWPIFSTCILLSKYILFLVFKILICWLLHSGQQRGSRPASRGP